MQLVLPVIVYTRLLSETIFNPLMFNSEARELLLDDIIGCKSERTQSNLFDFKLK